MPMVDTSGNRSLGLTAKRRQNVPPGASPGQDMENDPARVPKQPLPASRPKLLYLSEALPAFLISRTRGMAAHAKTVTVRILYIHFPHAPGHVRRGLTKDRTAFLVLLMQRIHVRHENADPCAGLSLASLGQENLDLPSGDATE